MFYTSILLLYRQPPRPSPASVTYSESDIGATPQKGPLPDDDDDGSSDTTQKPSDLEDSSGVRNITQLTIIQRLISL